MTGGGGSRHVIQYGLGKPILSVKWQKPRISDGKSNFRLGEGPGEALLGAYFRHRIRFCRRTPIPIFESRNILIELPFVPIGVFRGPKSEVLRMDRFDRKSRVTHARGTGSANLEGVLATSRSPVRAYESLCFTA
jgi:hypothetical protein